MTRRRGAQAVEFALILPILMTFASGMADLWEYLYLREGLVAAVSAGARAGATVNEFDLADPREVAKSTAATSWKVSGRGTAVFVASYTGTSPDRMLVLTGTAKLEPWFGLIDALPDNVTYTTELRTVMQ